MADTIERKRAILKDVCCGADLTAFLTTLPAWTLPPELLALRALGAVVNLADHWPVVHIAKISIEHARLGMAALPTFAGIFIDAGFTPLAWLDATLPPMMPVTLVVDPSISGVLGAIAYNWGDRITNVFVKSHKVQPDPVPDLLARCVNVQAVTIECNASRSTAAAYLAAIPTTSLYTLKVQVLLVDALDATAIVACHTELTRDGILALARALPAWMARGIETLQLDATGITDEGAVGLAVALTSKNNRRALTIDMSSNRLSVASAPLLLTTLGACRDVTLRLGHLISRREDSRDSDSGLNDERLTDLVQVHRLRTSAGGVFASPSRTSSPWQLH